MRFGIAALGCLLLGWQAVAAEYLPLPGGEFRSALPADGKAAPASIAPFLLRSRPVSNREFLAFVQRNPDWQRSKAPAALVGKSYLAGWQGDTQLGALAKDAPLTQVSWYAAAAYCGSEGARLPRWYEWEFAAAADPQRADARGDAAWLSQILNWYSRPANAAPANIGQGPANYYGLYDLHGLVWEWVEDFNGLFVSADSREQGEQKQLDYCGGAALSLADRQNYAVLMRIALLAAMEGNQSGPYLGFRCAKDG